MASAHHAKLSLKTRLASQTVFCFVLAKHGRIARVSGGAMLVGYARVSTHDQNPASQIEALKAAGFDRVFMGKRLAQTAIDQS